MSKFFIWSIPISIALVVEMALLPGNKCSGTFRVCFYLAYSWIRIISRFSLLYRLLENKSSCGNLLTILSSQLKLLFSFRIQWNVSLTVFKALFLILAEKFSSADSNSPPRFFFSFFPEVPC